MTRREIPAVGTTVRFREGTPQRASNGLDYVVEPAPGGAAYSLSAAGEAYVWLVVAADMDKRSSRRRRRTGFVSALECQS